MYLAKIPQEQMADLWRLREFAACGPIAKQVREAIANYLKAQEQKIGCSIQDIEEVIKRRETEKKTTQDWRAELENRIEDRNRRLSRKIY